MSRFSDEIARQLARDTFTYRIKHYASPTEQAEAESPGPLVGKEDELLHALQAAEQIYDQFLEEFLCLEKMRALDAAMPKRCEELATHLERALSCWSEMAGRQLELIYTFGEPQPERAVQRFEQALRQMISCARFRAEEPRLPPKVGRPRGKGLSGVPLLPLEEFTKVLRQFWIQETGSRFWFAETSMDHIDSELREPTSAAARLVWGAAKILDERCTLSNIKEVMAAVSKYPQLRDDILDRS
ncbi:hypothetical protein [Bradyrhizobium sp. URHD0069]|uniref:hypothetical protein n=1 Tax=Bradyrhizobium sp. URHD0069 TaxID=1380355 RepID=UPI0004960F95|nr:hypothetical protein [Bradyrhizobium sp. URHD0069]